MCIFRPMSDAYDPRQEFPANQIITGCVVLVALALVVVAYITKVFDPSDMGAPTAAATAPAEVPEKAPQDKKADEKKPEAKHEAKAEEKPAGH